MISKHTMLHSVINVILSITAVFIVTDKEVRNHALNHIQSFTSPYDFGAVKHIGHGLNGVQYFVRSAIIQPYETFSPILTPYETILRMWEANNSMYNDGNVYTIRDRNATFVFTESEAGFTFNYSNTSSYTFNWNNNTNSTPKNKIDPIKQMYMITIVRLLNEINRKEKVIQDMQGYCVATITNQADEIYKIKQQYRSHMGLAFMVILSMVYFIYKMNELNTIRDYKGFIVKTFFSIVVSVLAYHYTVIWEITKQIVF